MERLSRTKVEIARNISRAIMQQYRRGEISKDTAIKMHQKKGYEIPKSLTEESDDLYGELEEEELSEKRMAKRICLWCSR